MAREPSDFHRRPPRVLVFNQYYWPGVEATAHLLSELCTELADEFEITVVTGMLRDLPVGVSGEPGRSRRGGVEILRVPSTAFDRSRLELRALNYVTYLGQSLRYGLTAARPDVVLCMTDPPVIANVAHVVARRFGVPFVVISQDVFPEAAVALKRLQNPLVVSVLRFSIDFYLRRANRVVAIGETMRDRLQAKGAPAGRVDVIPNWTDTSSLTPRPRDNEWARGHGLDGAFVVMHSGNVGHAQNLDALIRAATFLRDLSDLRVVIVGSGARHAELVALARRLDAENVLFLPYQPRDVLPLSLSAASIHVVGLARGLSGYVVPSRLYGILAVGRPVIAAADETSETARLVARAGAGVVVPPGRPELLAAAIRRAYGGELPLDEMGARGRAHVEREADRAVAVDRYRRLLRGVVAERAAA